MKYKEINKDESVLTTRFGKIDIETFCGGYDRIIVSDDKNNVIANVCIRKAEE